jgi:hypothetical protein
MTRLAWSGTIVSVQPRIGLWRSFDERHFEYLGYSLYLHGIAGGHEGAFSVGVGKVAQAKLGFRVGDEVCGNCHPVADQRLQPVQFYRASTLQVRSRANERRDPPPWHGCPPDLDTYDMRGVRRLSVLAYRARCTSCYWGCSMPVTMLIDPWDPHYRYRFETFCYGPKSCPHYKPGPTRKVPGRKGMVNEEQDWVDEDNTEHRGWEE